MLGLSRVRYRCRVIGSNVTSISGVRRSWQNSRMARTHGLADIDKLSDGHLEHLIADGGLAVYEASLMFEKTEFDFACGTLERLLDERRTRKVKSPA